MSFQQTDLIDLAHATMPFGKYSGRPLIRLPEEYLLWFQAKGWPAGRLGQLMALALLIRSEGLESLITPLMEGRPR